MGKKLSLQQVFRRRRQKNNSSLPKNLHYFFVACKLLGAAPFRISTTGVVHISKPWLLYTRILRIVLPAMGLYTSAAGVLYMPLRFLPGIVGTNEMINVASYGMLLIGPWTEDMGVVRVQWTFCVIWFLLIFLPITYILFHRLVLVGVNPYIGQISYNFTDLTIFATEMQFVCCILIIMKQIKDINSNLRGRIGTLQREGILLRSTQNWSNQHEYCSYQSASYGGFLDSFSSPESKMSDVRTQHEVLIGILEDLKDLFSLPLLINLIYTTSQITTCLFRGLMATLRPQPIIFAVIYGAKFSAYVIVCSTTLMEAQQTATYVHDVMNEPAVDKNEWEECRLFAQQLLHRKAKFNLFGVPYDLRLFKMVIGITITQFIIMMQFQQALATTHP